MAERLTLTTCAVVLWGMMSAAAEPGLSPPRLPSSDACAKALQLGALPRSYAEARTEYERVFIISRDKCASDGIARLNKIRQDAEADYKLGKQIEKENIGVAREWYLKALQLDPSFADAADALMRVGMFKATTDPYAKARALARAGLNTDAIEAIKKASESGIDVPHDLAYLVGGGISWWREFLRQLDPIGKPLLELLAVIVALVSAAIAVYVHVFAKPRVEIGDFADDHLDMLKVGKSFAALLQQQVNKFSSNILPNVGFFAGSVQPAGVPSIMSSIPSSLSWLNAVPSIIAWLHPRRVFTVSGCAHPAGSAGAGMTMTLAENGRLIATSTIWQREFDPALTAKSGSPAAYQMLAQPAAIWLLFHLSKEG